MLLEWERFRKILEFNNNKDRHAQLLNIAHHVDFLSTFLTQLTKELKECKTAFETVEKFPDAGPLLTVASTHPYLGYTPSIATLLITCLTEYSKIDLDSNTDALLESATLNNKSMIWCIVRLRRFVSVAHKENDTQKIIQQISDLIDMKGDHLDAERISRLTDKCLSLIHEKEASRIIEKLVNCALAEEISTMHFDRPDPLLSDRFIHQLTNDTKMQKHYIHWPNELKIKLLNNYDDILEIELLDLIETYTTTQNDYTILDTLVEDQFMQHQLIQVLQASPHLTQRFMQKLSNYIIQFGNWKLVRFGQCMHRFLRTQFNIACSKIMNNATFHYVQAHDVHVVVLDYIYGDGPILDIPKRRNEAWCLSMSYTRFIWYCVYQIVEWCKKENEPWTCQMEDVLVYVNWLIYPSMDNRESESLSFLRNWIQSSQGNDGLYNELPNLWDNILNSNGIIVACFVTSMFFSTDRHLHVDQQISLIQSIFANPERLNYVHENPKNDSAGLIYMLLDYLNDMEFHASYYPPVIFNLNQIINHVYRTYL